MGRAVLVAALAVLAVAVVSAHRDADLFAESDHEVVYRFPRGARSGGGSRGGGGRGASGSSSVSSGTSSSFAKGYSRSSPSFGSSSGLASSLFGRSHTKTTTKPKSPGPIFVTRGSLYTSRPMPSTLRPALYPTQPTTKPFPSAPLYPTQGALHPPGPQTSIYNQRPIPASRQPTPTSRPTLYPRLPTLTPFPSAPSFPGQSSSYPSRMVRRPQSTNFPDRPGPAWLPEVPTSRPPPYPTQPTLRPFPSGHMYPGQGGAYPSGNIHGPQTSGNLPFRPGHIPWPTSAISRPTLYPTQPTLRPFPGAPMYPGQGVTYHSGISHGPQAPGNLPRRPGPTSSPMPPTSRRAPYQTQPTLRPFPSTRMYPGQGRAYPSGTVHRPQTPVNLPFRPGPTTWPTPPTSRPAPYPTQPTFRPFPSAPYPGEAPSHSPASVYKRLTPSAPPMEPETNFPGRRNSLQQPYGANNPTGFRAAVPSAPPAEPEYPSGKPSAPFYTSASYAGPSHHSDHGQTDYTGRQAPGFGPDQPGRTLDSYQGSGNSATGYPAGRYPGTTTGQQSHVYTPGSKDFRQRGSDYSSGLYPSPGQGYAGRQGLGVAVQHAVQYPRGHYPGSSYWSNSL